MNILTGIRTTLALATATVALAMGYTAAGSPGVAGPAPPAGKTALDYAFSFASAITPDPKDMGKAQEKVVVDVAATGDLEKAEQLAGRVHNWRKGTSLAEVARQHAVRGDLDRARVLAGRAALEIPRSEGWHRLRIRAQVAEARAWMGDLEAASEAAVALAQSDPVQYAGRAATIIILAHAARGEIEEALKRAAALDGSQDHAVALSRTLAYVEVARQASGDHRRTALDRALESSRDVPGWQRAGVLERIARALHGSGRDEDAREAIKAAVETAVATPETAPVRGLLLGDLARTSASFGMAGPLQAALAGAKVSARKAMDIDRPGIYGKIAAAYMAMGETEEARRTLDLALAEAAGLANARPRALALVDICRYVGREGYALDEATRERLDELYGGLKAPW